jgi:hypothetical protein
MNQRQVNQIQTCANRITESRRSVWYLILALLIASCASLPVVPPALAPWQVVNFLATAAPHDAPGLWTDGTKTLLAWPGEPSSPGIRLVDTSAPSHVNVLSLGRVPRSVSLFKADAGALHILWLDQTLPTQTELVGALIDTEGAIVRTPDSISKRRVTQYRAVSTSDGDVVTLWVEDRVPSSIYLQRVDSQGRAQQPVRIARTGTRPTLAFDLNGDLHVAWLESTSPSLWTIHYLFLPHGDPPVTPDVAAIPIGVIHLDQGRVLDSFTLGLDASHVYCLWGTIRVGSTTSEPSGKIAGLTFPISDSTTVHTLAMNMPDNVSLSALNVPGQTLPSFSVGLLASTWDGQRWNAIPAAMIISPNGSGTLHRAYTGNSSSALISGLTIAAAPDGTLVLGWSDLDDRGIAHVYYASTR